MKKTFLILILIYSFIGTQALFAQTSKSVSLTTYYPAPMGAYDQFRLIPFASGENIGDACDSGDAGLMHVEETDGQIRLCVNEGTGTKWSLISGSWKQVGNNITPSDPDEDIFIGIGTTDPKALLHIHDNEDGYGPPALPNTPNWADPNYEVASSNLGMLITGVDPAFSLIGEDASSGQSAIHMLEVGLFGRADQGDYMNMWSLGRQSSSAGIACDGCLYVAYQGNPVVGSHWDDACNSRLRIHPNGNVGIGRIAAWAGDGRPASEHQGEPQKDLHIAFNSGETTVRLQEISGVPDNIWDLKVTSGPASWERFMIHGGTEGILQERLNVLASNGYVGIGQIPSTQLELLPSAEGLLLENTDNPAIEFIDTTVGDSDFRIVNTGDILSFEYDDGSGSGWQTALSVENYISPSTGNPDERLVIGTPTVPYETDDEGELVVHGDGNLVLSDSSSRLNINFIESVGAGVPTPDHFDISLHSYNDSTQGPIFHFMENNDDAVERKLLSFVAATGNVGVQDHNPAYPFTIPAANNGAGDYFYCDNTGSWHDPSSREYKTDIKSLELSAALAALNELKPVTFKYKKRPHEVRVGFIAEELPDLVATEDHKTLSEIDIAATLTRVVQHQQEEIEKRNQILKEQEDLIQKMKDKLNSL